MPKVDWNRYFENEEYEEFIFLKDRWLGLFHVGYNRCKVWVPRFKPEPTWLREAVRVR